MHGAEARAPFEAINVHAAIARATFLNISLHMEFLSLPGGSGPGEKYVGETEISSAWKQLVGDVAIDKS